MGWGPAGGGPENPVTTDTQCEPAPDQTHAAVSPRVRVGPVLMGLGAVGGLGGARGLFPPAASR